MRVGWVAPAAAGGLLALALAGCNASSTRQALGPDATGPTASVSAGASTAAGADTSTAGPGGPTTGSAPAGTATRAAGPTSRTVTSTSSTSAVNDAGTRPTVSPTAATSAPSASSASSVTQTAAAALPTVTFGPWTGIRPSTIYFSADAGNVVSRLSWSRWTETSAAGSGTWGYDDCQPNCAQGTVTDYPATLTVSRPSGGQFTRLVEVQSGPHGQTFTFTLPQPYMDAAS